MLKQEFFTWFICWKCLLFFSLSLFFRRCFSYVQFSCIVSIRVRSFWMGIILPLAKLIRNSFKLSTIQRYFNWNCLAAFFLFVYNVFGLDLCAYFIFDDFFSTVTRVKLDISTIYKCNNVRFIHVNMSYLSLWSIMSHVFFFWCKMTYMCCLNKKNHFKLKRLTSRHIQGFWYKKTFNLPNFGKKSFSSFLFSLRIE